MKTEDQPTSEVASQPQFQDIHLKEFQENNPHCKIAIEEDSLVLQNPWGSDDSRLSFELTDIEIIEELNSIVFNPQFDAIIHQDRNEVEFIYGYIHPDKEPWKSHLNRQFNIHFSGTDFECRFAEPTERLFKIASRVRRFPSDSGERVVPQLMYFRDSQRLDDLPPRATEYFSKRVPRSFFLKTGNPILSIDLEETARHINFLMHYYDRRSPVIEMRIDSEETSCENVRPKRFCEGEFPTSFAMNKIDDFILQLIEVARNTTPRFAFIYYFQIIEYAGFYFIDEKVKKTLRHLLKDPTLVTCPDTKIHELFAAFSDLAHNDDGRMKKVIEECCDPAVLWQDIENDRVFFSSQIIFDGGFTLPPLISNDSTKDSWSTMWMPKLYDQLTKIRNCLVHAREKRHSNVISPSKANNCRIERYLPLIARLAEQIALKNE